MNRPSDQSVEEMLSWICPNRKARFEWCEPKTPLVDGIQYELLIQFTDDDLDMGAFRQIVNNYMAHCVVRKDRPPLGRVVFTLENVWTVAAISTVRGRLECAQHDHVTGASASVDVVTRMEPMQEGWTATFVGKEYYIDGRRHRSNHLPAVERQVTHVSAKLPSEHIETNTEVQYWEEGQPRMGPRPWQITSDATIFSENRGRLSTNVHNLEVKWMVDWQEDKIPEHPVKLTVGKVITTSRPHKENEPLLPEWMPEHPQSPNIIEGRVFEDLKLYWALKPGRIAVISGEELFGELGIKPLNIDWGGSKFFLDANEDFALMCYLSSGNAKWHI